ncbi:hypothetical protein K431DRAFT_285517 [Polychaeton citri CBS 116435]|uniref:SnoaL-like domain-containing protein n=1 Tax=Polychaeton citri CBS 116435 TaxID=1314669 RepID=A0A9P4UPJ4_9PEZI|nr:hypothetical protein K431DRAFT_285517 [Polychaeton citri CBS 116435]
MEVVNQNPQAAIGSTVDLYGKLTSTARQFVEATSPRTLGTNEINYDGIRALAAPGFFMTWGPKTFVSTRPGLQQPRAIDEFLEHMEGMCPHLDTWEIEVYDVTTDVSSRAASVRANFYMKPKGQEKVLNDIVFFLKMNEEGTLVTEGCEYLDGEASRIIQERIVKAKQQVQRF